MLCLNLQCGGCSQLHGSRTELYSDMKKLHEANVKLRERNLGLSQELHQRGRENTELRLAREQVPNSALACCSDSSGQGRSRERSQEQQLERLQAVVMRGTARTLSREEQWEQEGEEGEGETISSLESKHSDMGPEEKEEEVRYSQLNLSRIQAMPSMNQHYGFPRGRTQLDWMRCWVRVPRR